MAGHLFQYQPLPVAQGVIRLLDVDLTGHHQHRLIQQAQLREQKYLALSYTWGSNQQQLQISLDGRSFPVNPNLSSALEAVRIYWTATFPERNVLLLWVDQICIDQNNEYEKNHQVSMMRDIYQSAHQVLVWLPQSDGCAHGFQTWPAWRDWHERQVLSSDASSAQAPTFDEAMTYSNDQNNNVAYPGQSTHERRTNNTLIAWNNVSQIVTSPWWERAWVYQEFMGCSRVMFLIDGLFAPWEELDTLLKTYFNRRQNHVDFCTKTLETLKVMETSACIRCPEGCDSCLHCCRTCCGECKEIGQRHGQDWDSQIPEIWRCCGRVGGCFEWMLRRCDAGPATNSKSKDLQRKAMQRHSRNLIESAGAWRLANFMMKSKAELNAKQRSSPAFLPLIQLMGHARNCQATQAVDKVYAFLGLAEPGHAIQVEYSKRLNTLLTEVSVAIIQREQRLDILAIARENTATQQAYARDGLPSWVPDWSTKDDANTTYRNFLRDIRYPTIGHSYGMDPVRASKNSTAHVSFQADGYGNANSILRARGILADRLSRALANRADESFARFSGSSGIEIQTARDARVGDEVWVLFGADELFTMRSQGSTRTIIGHAMHMERGPIFGDVQHSSLQQRMREAQATTLVRDGGLMEKLKRGEVVAQDILIA